jgi:hypothetical protein
METNLFFKSTGTMAGSLMDDEDFAEPMQVKRMSRSSFTML